MQQSKDKHTVRNPEKERKKIKQWKLKKALDSMKVRHELNKEVIVFQEHTRKFKNIEQNQAPVDQIQDDTLQSDVANDIPDREASESSLSSTVTRTNVRPRRIFVRESSSSDEQQLLKEGTPKDDDKINLESTHDETKVATADDNTKNLNKRSGNDSKPSSMTLIDIEDSHIESSSSTQQPPAKDALQEGDKTTFLRNADRHLTMALWDFDADDLKDSDDECPENDEDAESSFLPPNFRSLEEIRSQRRIENTEVKEILSEKKRKKQHIKDVKAYRKEKKKIQKAEKKQKKIEKKKEKKYNKQAKKTIKKARKAAKKRAKKGKKEIKKSKKAAKKRIKNDKKLIKLKIKEDKILSQLTNGGKKVKKPKRKIKFYRKRNHSCVIFALIGKYCCACLPLAPLENEGNVPEKGNEVAQKRKWDPDWDLVTVTADTYSVASCNDDNHSIASLKDIPEDNDPTTNQDLDPKDVFNLPGQSPEISLWPEWHILSFITSENGYPADEPATRYPRTYLDPEKMDTPHLLRAQHRGEIDRIPDIEYDLDVDKNIVSDDWVVIKTVRVPDDYREYEEMFTQEEWSEYFEKGTGPVAGQYRKGPQYSGDNSSNGGDDTTYEHTDFEVFVPLQEGKEIAAQKFREVKELASLKTGFGIELPCYGSSCDHEDEDHYDFQFPSPPSTPPLFNAISSHPLRSAMDFFTFKLESSLKLIEKTQNPLSWITRSAHRKYESDLSSVGSSTDEEIVSHREKMDHVSRRKKTDQKQIRYKRRTDENIVSSGEKEDRFKETALLVEPDTEYQKKDNESSKSTLSDGTSDSRSTIFDATSDSGSTIFDAASDSEFTLSDTTSESESEHNERGSLIKPTWTVTKSDIFHPISSDSDDSILETTWQRRKKVAKVGEASSQSKSSLMKGNKSKSNIILRALERTRRFLLSRSASKKSKKSTELLSLSY